MGGVCTGRQVRVVRGLDRSRYRTSWTYTLQPVPAEFGFPFWRRLVVAANPDKTMRPAAVGMKRSTSPSDLISFNSASK